MYRQMFKAFETVRDNDSDDISISDIVAAAKANMLECNKKMAESGSSDPLKEYLERARVVHSQLHKQFTDWCLLIRKKTQTGNFGLTLFSVTCYHICAFSNLGS